MGKLSAGAVPFRHIYRKRRRRPRDRRSSPFKTNPTIPRPSCSQAQRLPFTTQGRYTSQRPSGQEPALAPLPPSRQRCAHRAGSVIPGRGPQPPSTRTRPSSSERPHPPAHATAAPTSLSRLRIQGIVRGVALNIIPPSKPRKSAPGFGPPSTRGADPCPPPPSCAEPSPSVVAGHYLSLPEPPSLPPTSPASPAARSTRHKQTWKLYLLSLLAPL